MGFKTAMNISLNNHKSVLALIVVYIALVEYTFFKEFREIKMYLKGIKCNS